MRRDLGTLLALTRVAVGVGAWSALGAAGLLADAPSEELLGLVQVRREAEADGT